MFLKKLKADFFGDDPVLDPEDIVATLPSVCSRGTSEELGEEFDVISILSSIWAAAPPSRGLRLGAVFFSESELSDTVITSFLGSASAAFTLGVDDLNPRDGAGADPALDDEADLEDALEDVGGALATPPLIMCEVIVV